MPIGECPFSFMNNSLLPWQPSVLAARREIAIVFHPVIITVVIATKEMYIKNTNNNYSEQQVNNNNNNNKLLYMYISLTEPCVASVATTSQAVNDNN